MKTFAEFIAEGRDYPLYHGVGWENGAAILKSRVIEPRTLHPSNKLLLKHSELHKKRPAGLIQGISTTRVLQFAKLWSPHQFVFELDHKAISDRFRIIPIQYFDWHGVTRRRESLFTGRGGFGDGLINEYEEFVVTTRPIPIDQYVKRIYVGPKLRNMFTQWADREINDMTPDWIIESKAIYAELEEILNTDPKYKRLVHHYS